MFWTTSKDRAAKPRTYVRGTGFAAEGACTEVKSDIQYKTFSQRICRLEREINFTTKSTKDTKGSQIENNFVYFVVGNTISCHWS